MYKRNKITNTEVTLVWDTVYCASCMQQYIRPTDTQEPCPYCEAVGR